MLAKEREVTRNFFGKKIKIKTLDNEQKNLKSYNENVTSHLLSSRLIANFPSEGNNIDLQNRNRN